MFRGIVYIENCLFISRFLNNFSSSRRFPMIKWVPSLQLEIAHLWYSLQRVQICVADDEILDWYRMQNNVILPVYSFVQDVASSLLHLSHRKLFQDVDSYPFKFRFETWTAQNWSSFRIYLSQLERLIGSSSVPDITQCQGSKLLWKGRRRWNEIISTTAELVLSRL